MLTCKIIFEVKNFGEFLDIIKKHDQVLSRYLDHMDDENPDLMIIELTSTEHYLRECLTYLKTYSEEHSIKYMLLEVEDDLILM